MDPAKIGGFLDVLIDLAKSRQVIVFSHDDRLPAAIRARSIPAQLLDVTREEGSVVTVRLNDSPAQRYIEDATALILDDQLDALVKRKAAPGLFRMAVEAAAHQRFFSERARAGAVYHESESTWEGARTTRQRIALAVTGTASGDISGWRSFRPHRAPTMRICTSGAHEGAVIDRAALNDLRNTVRDIAEGCDRGRRDTARTRTGTTRCSGSHRDRKLRPASRISRTSSGGGTDRWTRLSIVWSADSPRNGEKQAGRAEVARRHAVGTHPHRCMAPADRILSPARVSVIADGG